MAIETTNVRVGEILRRACAITTRIASVALPMIIAVGCDEVAGPRTPAPLCGGGRSNPVTAASATRVLRTHRLTVHRLRRDVWCAPDRSVVLSNQVDFVANTDEAVHAREGWYSCVLYKRSHQNGLTSNLDHDANASIAGSKHAEWDLENLSCSLYPSSSEHWDEQIHRFDLAVIDLAAQVRRTNAS